MSNLEASPAVRATGGLADVAARPVHELLRGREVLLGESTRVRRVLPNLGRRLVGAWCFIDHYGPDDVANGPGMQVPPHPHIGLQTVSWLLDGQVHHRDSLGNDQIVRPGTLGLMSAGRGIAHAEQSPVPHPALLHGLQLWVALPDGHRDVAPAWDFHADLPTLTDSGMTATVLMGSIAGAMSPGRCYSPLVGVDVALGTGGDVALPLEPEFEYALVCASGTLEVENTVLAVGSMLYLGCGRRELRLRSEPGAHVLLLGGEPFDEQIVMWWNFVARSTEEIAQAREQWMTGERFGVVPGAEPLPAPPLPPGRLKPGGSTRR
jgi:redox-sensitive bicupin YhaK (pirin superfamily)